MPNRTLPEELKISPFLLKCSRDARLFFFYLWLTVDDYRRAPVGLSPSNPVILRAMCYPAEPQIRIADVARWLHEMQLAGAVAVRDSERGWYVEIAEHLWYRREDYAAGQPKYGPRNAAPAQQTALPLGPVGAVEDAPTRARRAAESRNKPAQGVAPSVGDVPTQALRIRTDYEHGNATDSARGREDSGSRVLSQISDSKDSKGGKFARDGGHFPGDAAWSDFCRLLLPDMVSNGALWVIRWQENRGKLVDAMQDWNAKTPQERAQGGGNAARYVTACWMKGRAA